MTHRATGPFDVKLSVLELSDMAQGTSLGRMSISKQFHGDLEAVSTGEMLSTSTSVTNSAGYVAIEQVTGTLQGHTGTFVLQHFATMERGDGKLSISVVPDSGTGQLMGLAGTMNIVMIDGKHAYEFDYTLP